MTWFDWTILDFIQNHLRSGGMDPLMVWITTLGNGGAVWLAIAAVLLLRKRTRLAGVCLLAAIAFTAVCCNLGLKPLIARPRPCHLDPSVHLLIPNPTDFSFPSGHTAASFAAVAALYYFRCRYWYLAGTLAVLIAFSRLYLYVHFPTDILAGALLGLMLGWCSVTLVRLIFRKTDLKRRKKTC